MFPLPRSLLCAAPYTQADKELEEFKKWKEGGKTEVLSRSMSTEGKLNKQVAELMAKIADLEMKAAVN